jgi:hypothetical protein
MHLIYVSADESAALISAIAQHLPAGWSLGRILAVGAENLMAVDPAGKFACYGIDQACDYAWRMVQVSAGLCEVTHWARGAEVRRYLVAGRM